VTGKIVGRALFEIEHAQQPDDEQQGRRRAQDGISRQEPDCDRARDLLPDQHELDCNHGDERKRREVMQEGE
jgi:hypothetical protein